MCKHNGKQGRCARECPYFGRSKEEADLFIAKRELDKAYEAVAIAKQKIAIAEQKIQDKKNQKEKVESKKSYNYEEFTFNWSNKE